MLFLETSSRHWFRFVKNVTIMCIFFQCDGTLIDRVLSLGIYLFTLSLSAVYRLQSVECRDFQLIWKDCVRNVSDIYRYYGVLRPCNCDCTRMHQRRSYQKTNWSCMLEMFSFQRILINCVTCVQNNVIDSLHKYYTNCLAVWILYSQFLVQWKSM